MLLVLCLNCLKINTNINYKLNEQIKRNVKRDTTAHYAQIP